MVRRGCDHYRLIGGKYNLHPQSKRLIAKPNPGYSTLRKQSTFAPHLPEARKFPLGPLPQPLQNGPHLRQLVLQPRPRTVIRPLVQLLIHLALQLRRPMRGILRHDAGCEFDIEGGLHERGEGVAFLASAEAGQERGDDSFE